jgi:serralysin
MGIWSPSGVATAGADTFVGEDDDIDTVDGLAGDDILNGNGGDDDLIGGDGADTLNGGAGRDHLSGSASEIGDGSVDHMYGGIGDDLYEIYDINDIVHEDPGGFDYDRAWVHINNYVVAANLDWTFLVGPDALNATANEFGSGIQGNEFANTLTGSDAGDVLYGEGSGDTLIGAAGGDYLEGGAGDDELNGGDDSDQIIGGPGADQIVGGDGIDVATYLESAPVNIDLTLNVGFGGNATGDTFFGVENITGSIGNDQLKGDSEDNTLVGASGNDVLIGAGGADILGGGELGSDTASYVGSAAVSINLLTHAVSGGDAAGDSLFGIENLLGSSFNDALIGDNGANVLNGGAGLDMLVGDLGNDTFIVDNADDVTLENADEGVDTVQSSVTRMLGANIENLTLTGGAIVNGAGNALANIITGNIQANILTGGGGGDTMNGGRGKDQLTGGVGNDKFVFNVAATAANVDRVHDFTHNRDTIVLENSIFTKLGAPALNLAASKFWVGATAHDASDRIIYNAANGQLFYDGNGTGAGQKFLIATLDAGLTLTAGDFQVI